MIDELLANRAIVSWFVAGVSAQCIKILLGLLRRERFDFRWVTMTGGMPSTHAAGVCAVTASLAIDPGVGSPLFAMALAFTIIIMFDAQGVRRSVGRQAQTLNKILTDIANQRGIQHDRVFELLGHTPTQVLVGAMLGILVALSMSSK